LFKYLNRELTMILEKMSKKLASQKGFIAALDQSGGSTPNALALYGIEKSDYNSDEEMMDLVHRMRTRIITSPAFDGNRILAAILFEDTLDRCVLDRPTASYLWQEKQIIPFLKIDKGLADEKNGVHLMKDMPTLDLLLDKALAKGVFGTKMRSFIKSINNQGIVDIVEQQFTLAKQIISRGLMPIIEPEVDINCPDKIAVEKLLKAELLKQLDNLESDQKVMLKLTLPDIYDFYEDCIAHPNVVRVVALSGGYSRELANDKVLLNKGIIASFSRSLTEGLSALQSDDTFNESLNNSIESIFQSSQT